MPQFLKQRYNEHVALLMAIFWLFLYVFREPHFHFVPGCYCHQ